MIYLVPCNMFPDPNGQGKAFMRKGLVALLFLAFTSFIAAQALNNDSVVKMVKAGLTDDVIVATINANSGAYDTSADGLIALKHAGVSNKIIDAIVAKSTAYKDSGGNWQPLPSEVVIFQSGGLVKHVASAGLVKEDLNGLVGGMRSRLVVSTPVTFILHVPQGRTASDYELVRLHVVANNRQFQSVAGGLMQASSSSLRDEIDFTSKQIGPSAYQIVLNNGLGEGEFGFLAPPNTSPITGADTTAPKTPASSGQIFTFAIVN